MNKKLKKALYMFGFALPIVAIPIITVACGTQTSQVEPTPTPAPTPAPEQQPNKEPEVKKIEEVKPNLNVLKETNIDEKFLSNDLKQLLNNWKEKTKFEIKEIKENKLFAKLIQTHINENDGSNNVSLKGELKYSDILQSISELKFVDLFDISSLNIQNLDDSKKLDTIKLTDVASVDLENLINEIKSKNETTFAKQDSNYDSNDNSNNDSIKKKIKELIDKNTSSSFQKINSYLDEKDTFDSNKLKEALKKFKFSDLINIEKLQDSLSYIKES